LHHHHCHYHHRHHRYGRHYQNAQFLNLTDGHQIIMRRLIDNMEMPKQVRCLLNNCISNFLDTPQEESCANFKTETLKHLSDFKLGLRKPLTQNPSVDVTLPPATPI
jgi:hypothetical protein